MVIEHDNDYRFKPWQWMKQGLLRLCLCRRLYSSLCLCFRLCLLLFLLLFLSLFLCTSFASPVAIAQSQRLVVDAHTAHYNAGQALQMIEDASQRLEFANVLNPTAALPWQTAIQNHSDDVGLGYTRSACESDLVARVGGDEFIIMLEHTRFPDGMTNLAQKLLTIINEPILLQAGTTKVSGSIGIASYPEHADSASLLLKHADAAMYQAKLLGRNQYAMAADMTPPLTPQDQQNQQGHQAQPVQPAQQTQQPEQSQQPTPSQQQPSV